MQAADPAGTSPLPSWFKFPGLEPYPTLSPTTTPCPSACFVGNEKSRQGTNRATPRLANLRSLVSLCGKQTSNAKLRKVHCLTVVNIKHSMKKFFFNHRLKFIGNKVVWVITILFFSVPSPAETLIDNAEIDSIEIFARSTNFFHTAGPSLFPYLYFMEICRYRYLKESHVWYESIKSKEIIYGFSQSMNKLKKPSFINKVFKRRTIKRGMFEHPLLCVRVSYSNGEKKILIISENKQFCWLSNEAFLINLDLIAFLLDNIEFKMKGDLFLFVTV